LAPLYTVKRLFVQRRAAKKYGPEQAATFDGRCCARSSSRCWRRAQRAALCEHVDRWMKAEAEHAAALDLAARYAAWATHTPQGQRLHRAESCSRCRTRSIRTTCGRRDEVVDGVTDAQAAALASPARDGFALTSPGMDLTAALDHANLLHLVP